MKYGSDCGCNAPAPKPAPAYNLNVPQKAPTDTIACPDDRCRDYMLGSAPESETATESVLGLSKGRSYIVPMSAMLAAYLKPSLNALYRGTEIPVAVNYRDIQAIQVVQKENCDKLAVAAPATVLKAMMSETAVAPAGYQADKVLTTDKNGDVFAQDATELVSNEFVEAAIDNCVKAKFPPVTEPTFLMTFGKGCKDFGLTTIENLSVALSKVLPLAPAKELPDAIRGFFGGKEKLYPVVIAKSKNFTSSSPASAGGPSAATANVKIAATTLQLPPGLYVVTADFTGGVGWNTAAPGYASLATVIRRNDNAGPVYGSSSLPVYFTTGSNLGAAGVTVGSSVSSIVDLPEGGILYADSTWYNREAFLQIGANSGSLTLRASQISQSTLLVNGVV